MNKEQLEKHLNYFKELYNLAKRGNPINDIKLFSGIKPSSYFVPNLFVSRNTTEETIKRHEEIRNAPSWFVEIWIDGLCIWRKSSLVECDISVAGVLEQGLIDAIADEIFCYGINSSWSLIKERHEITP